MDIKYGCINEDEFTLRGPRMIDTDECDTLAEAFDLAREMIEDGCIKVSITRCKYYGKPDEGWWGEIPGDGQISVDAYNVDWLVEEDDEDA